MSYDLCKLTDEWMTRNRVYLPRGSHLYPSESSVKYIDQHGLERTEGTCLRQVWYRLMGGYEASKPDPYSEWIFALGRAVEEILVEQWKQMGIWVANNVKFYDSDRNISGEVDVLLSEPDGTLYCCEVKSFYGYRATRDIVGNTKVTGKPKTSQMLQAMVYADLGRRLESWNYVKMVYYARDAYARNEFDIALIEDGEFLRPTINGVIDYRFTMQDIYDRYEELTGYVQRGEMPPRDYEKEWSPEKVKQMHDLGEVSKSAYDKWRRNPRRYPVGDWMCSYCQYKSTCYRNN